MDAFDQSIHDWIDGFGWLAAALVRIGLAAACGAMVGLEREIRGREAGFRTNLLVCMGCAIVMVVSQRVALTAWPDLPGRSVQVDPARIAYGVMAGIGFLGAGVIVKYGTDVRGLTTAAGIWCVAGVGLGSGMGLYGFSVLATVIVVAALWWLDLLARWLPKTHYRLVELRRPWSDGAVAKTTADLRSAGYRVGRWALTRSDDHQSAHITVTVSFRNQAELDGAPARLATMSDFELLSIRHE